MTAPRAGADIVRDMLAAGGPAIAWPVCKTLADAFLCAQDHLSEHGPDVPMPTAVAESVRRVVKATVRASGSAELAAILSGTIDERISCRPLEVMWVAVVLLADLGSPAVSDAASDYVAAETEETFSRDCRAIEDAASVQP